jgi:DNA-directed RNA polymerase subunit D
MGDACIKACPRGVIGKEDGRTVIVDPESCTLCLACVDVCVTKAISVDGDMSKFIFEFETDGSLTAQKTLLKALEILENKFDEFKELVSTLET